MRTLFIFVLCILSLNVRSATVVCTNLIDSIATIYPATAMKFTPVSKVPQQYGDQTVMPAVVQVGVTNGAFEARIVAGGIYLAEPLPKQSFVPPVSVLIPSNDTNSYTFNQVIGWATNANNFYWTNVWPFAAGTNITFTTNGQVLVINASGGSGSGTTYTFTPTNLAAGILVTNGSTVFNGTNLADLATSAALVSSNYSLIAREKHINVLDYGAVADAVIGTNTVTGTTNTTAFQSAINAGAISNLPVRIPAGNYVISSLQISNSSYIFGDGIDKTILIAKGAANGGGFLGSSNAAVTIRDLSLTKNIIPNVGATNSSYATNATAPVAGTAIYHNADGPGGVYNVRVSGFQIGLRITGTDSILTRPQRATYDALDITNCTYGIITDGPNNSEYITIGSLVNVANCWLGWSNAAAANIVFAGKIRDCPGYSYWQRGTTNDTYGFRGHSKWTPTSVAAHCGSMVLQNANNVTFEGAKLDHGGQVMGLSTSGTIVLDATTNAVFNDCWIACLNAPTGNLLQFTNGGYNNSFSSIRVPIGSGTNIIGATTTNSKGWSVWSDEFGYLFQPAASWTGTSNGVFAGDGSGLTNLNASYLASGTVPSARLTGVTVTNATLVGNVTGFPVEYCGAMQSLSATATGYTFPPCGLNKTPYAFSVANEATQRFPLKRSGTLTNLVFRLVSDTTAAAFGTGTNTAVFVYTNGVATTFGALSVSDGSTTRWSSGSASLTVPANTDISLRTTNTVALVIDIAWSLTFQP